MPPTIVLFDIDGTLIRTARAGSRAMNRAFLDLFQVPDAFEGIEMAGRTDKWILQDAAARSGVRLSTQTFQRLLNVYFDRLEATLAEPALDKRVLPGVRELLDELALRDDVFLALLTGNCETGARLKLEHFGLWKYFCCGAFGDDAHDRNELFPIAMFRASACGVSVQPRNAVIVGDTVLDVACAKASGARSLAVATGPSSFDALTASGADLVLHDLSNRSAVLQLLENSV